MSKEAWYTGCIAELSTQPRHRLFTEENSIRLISLLIDTLFTESQQFTESKSESKSKLPAIPIWFTTLQRIYVLIPYLAKGIRTCRFKLEWFEKLVPLLHSALYSLNHVDLLRCSIILSCFHWIGLSCAARFPAFSDASGILSGVISMLYILSNTLVIIPSHSSNNHGSPQPTTTTTNRLYIMHKFQLIWVYFYIINWKRS